MGKSQIIEPDLAWFCKSWNPSSEIKGRLEARECIIKCSHYAEIIRAAPTWRLHIVRCYEPVSEAQESADNFGVTLNQIGAKSRQSACLFLISY